jgi:hypothetical protein
MSNRWDYEMDARKVATWVREIFGNDFVSFLSTTNQAVDSDNEIALQEHQNKSAPACRTEDTLKIWKFPRYISSILLTTCGFASNVE